MLFKLNSLRAKLSIGLVAITAAVVAAAALAPASEAKFFRNQVDSFEHVVTFDVSGAEIVAAAPNGKLLVYTDAGGNQIGFLDITDPAAPVDGTPLGLPGSPTSVAITPDGKWALVCVHDEGDYTPNDDDPPADVNNPDPDDLDYLVIVRMSNRTIARTITLGGQPDSVAISPNGRYAAIAIENERSEDWNDGIMPQAPAGFLTIVDLVGQPNNWGLRNVSLTGIPDRFPTDPEPEFVTINVFNQAAVTLQENNHIVIVNLKNGNVVRDWSAGTTTHTADLSNDNPDAANFDETLTNARREPDGIVWSPLGALITANEGDYDFGECEAPDFICVGGRDFTIFSAFGNVLYEPGSAFEEAIAAAGLYDDGRSDDRGVEPEGAEVGVYGLRSFLFIGGERCACVVVYRLEWGFWPVFVQVLETGDRPEGLLAIPNRNLFVTANEDDGDISIFRGVSD